MHRQALDIREKEFGPKNVATANSLRYLGNNLNHQGRFEEAEPLLRRASEIRIELRGLDHPETATTTSSLARSIRTHWPRGNTWLPISSPRAAPTKPGKSADNAKLNDRPSPAQNTLTP